MTHPEIDPSLRPAEPLLESLDDGFSPPMQVGPGAAQQQTPATEPMAPMLSPKSPF